jgi:hypothetical protein
MLHVRSMQIADVEKNRRTSLLAEESERQVKELAAWKVKARSPEDTPPRRLSGRKKWELEASARPHQLGKPPDFFDVTKRNEDGGVVATISSVKVQNA